MSPKFHQFFAGGSATGKQSRFARSRFIPCACADSTPNQQSYGVRRRAGFRREVGPRGSDRNFAALWRLVQVI